MQSIAKQRVDCELQYLLSRSVRSRRSASPLKRLLELRCLPFLRGACSATGSAPLRHVASQALRAIWFWNGRVNIHRDRKTKRPLLRTLCFWIPAATYSPGFTVRKGRLPSPLKRLGILPCSLGFRLASSPAGRARLLPVFSQALEASFITTINVAALSGSSPRA